MRMVNQIDGRRKSSKFSTAATNCGSGRQGSTHGTDATPGRHQRHRHGALMTAATRVLPRLASPALSLKSVWVLPEIMGELLRCMRVRRYIPTGLACAGKYERVNRKSGAQTNIRIHTKIQPCIMTHNADKHNKSYR